MTVSEACCWTGVLLAAVGGLLLVVGGAMVGEGRGATPVIGGRVAIGGALALAAGLAFWIASFWISVGEVG